MADLPPELVCTIVENLENSRRDLCTLALVSHLFHREAIRPLYRSIKDPDENVHSEFLSTLRHSPQLALLVHIYHVPRSTPEGGITWKILERPLMLMSSLKELALHNIIPYPVPKGIPFQLDTLIWTTNRSADVMDKSFHIHEFLYTQQNIKTLQWHSSCDPPSLPWGLNLRTLGGDTKMILKTLPGRSIVNLYWRDKDDFISGFLPKSSPALRMKEFAKLRALSMELLSLCRLAKVFLEGPQPLHLEGIHVLEIHGRMGDSLVFKLARRTMGLFPNLQKLIIRPPTSYGPQEQQRYSENEIPDFYKDCANLIHVDLWSHGIYYKRWEQKSLLPLPGFLVVPDDKVLTMG